MLSRKYNFLCVCFLGSKTNRSYPSAPEEDGWEYIHAEPWHCARTADVFYASAAKKYKGKRARLQFLVKVGNKVMTDGQGLGR